MNFEIKEFTEGFENQISSYNQSEFLATESHCMQKNDDFFNAAKKILYAAGEDASREGLRSTPQRFSRAMEFLLSGYKTTAKEVVGEGVFASEGNGVVSVNNVEFYSQCEHHMLPFWGKTSVAYYPNKKILGLSKIPRIVDVYARRLQVQERLTSEIKNAICHLITPRAIVVRIKACHMCMMMRGVQKQGSHTFTEETFGIESLSHTEQQRIFAAISNEAE